MLVDQLRMSVTAQQQGEIVKPCDDALEFHTVDKKNCNRSLVLPDRVKEHFLNVLILFVGHCTDLLFVAFQRMP